MDHATASPIWLPRLRAVLTVLCSNLLAIALIMLFLLSAVYAAESDPISSAEEARRWWLEAAEQGQPDMQYGLARMYETGAPTLGIASDAVLALKWYQRAGEQGHGPSLFAIGRLYEEGRGVEADRATALHWYGQAADRGHEAARERIAELTGDKPAETVPHLAAAEPLPATTPPAGSLERTRESLLGLAQNVFVQTSAGPYWSWWQGAAALALIMLAFWLLVRAPLGVSSSWDHVVHWRDYERMQRAEGALEKNQDAVTDALLAETIAQFGNAAVAQLRAQPAGAAKKIAVASTSKAPWPTHFTFLACMLLGGLFASFFAGNWQVQWSLGPEFERLFGAGWHTWVLLTAGGFLVGFGTRMAGGCTSGHGVNGCARLQPGSLVGTVSFFGTAVAMTLLLERVLS